MNEYEAAIARLEDKLEAMIGRADLYRALWMQTGVIVVATAAAVVALLKLLP